MSFPYPVFTWWYVRKQIIKSQIRLLSGQIHMTLLYCKAIWNSAQLSHLPSALVSRCAFSQVTFCCQLQYSWHFKMSLLRTSWSTSGFHKKCCWSPLRDLPFVSAKGIVHPAFSRQHPRKFWSFAVLSSNSVPVSQFPASFTSEWRIQMDSLALFAVMLFTWSTCSIFFYSSVQCNYDIGKLMFTPFHEALVISYKSGLQDLIRYWGAHLIVLNLISYGLYHTVYCIIF